MTRMRQGLPEWGWAVPCELGCTPGFQIACSACQGIEWQPWDGPVPLGGLPDSGYMAQDCPRCGHPLVIEVGPDWGWHRTPYPEWLEQQVLD